MSEELNESVLGTQEHWNELYDTELKNYKDHGDKGEIWYNYFYKYIAYISIFESLISN